VLTTNKHTCFAVEEFHGEEWEEEEKEGLKLKPVACQEM
jgi:hypothetical protein